MGGPGPGRQAPIAGPVGQMGCIWLATRCALHPFAFIPPGERAHLALAPHRPASPGAPPAPYAQPHNGALGLITSPWRSSPTLCARRHLAPSPTGTKSAQSMLTMQPTRRCPQAHRPNAHIRRWRARSSRDDRGVTSKAAAPAFIGRACLCRRLLTQPSLISDGLPPSSSRCRPASLRSSPRRATCTPAAPNRLSWSSRCSLATCRP